LFGRAEFRDDRVFGERGPAGTLAARQSLARRYTGANAAYGRLSFVHATNVAWPSSRYRLGRSLSTPRPPSGRRQFPVDLCGLCLRRAREDVVAQAALALVRLASRVERDSWHELCGSLPCPPSSRAALRCRSPPRAGLAFIQVASRL